jgi:hypothetical protein
VIYLLEEMDLNVTSANGAFCGLLQSEGQALVYNTAIPVP